MWANAQRDGRPAEYRWRPLFNAAKFGWHPLLECRAVMLPRRETRWNLQGCPKLANRSQTLVGRSSPYYEDMWRRYRRLTGFFRLSIHASAAKIQPDKVVRGCQNGNFLRPLFSASHMQHMCGSMVDIQSPTAEIRQGKKRRNIETTEQKYNGLPYVYVGWP